ncbi:MAG: hypothetical protein M3285_02390 [Actinomycetota bacterium]|nr:hypothetical protein [Actinomycetota bacterium]
MFVQVIHGRASNADGLEDQWRKWVQEIKPGAEGYLGSTGGITADGRFITVARFESEASARRNSDRPEQSRWWSETEGYLEDPTFVDCTDVEEWMGGGSDEAGFVQIIQGSSEEDRDMTPEDEEQVRKTRPDLIGGISAKHPDNKTWTTAAYFKDEPSARRGEKDPDFQKAMEEAGATPDLNTYWDLSSPWLDSA